MAVAAMGSTASKGVRLGLLAGAMPMAVAAMGTTASEGALWACLRARVARAPVPRLALRGHGRPSLRALGQPRARAGRWQGRQAVRARQQASARARLGPLRPSSAPLVLAVAPVGAGNFFVTAQTYPMSDGWTGTDSLRTTIGGCWVAPPRVGRAGQFLRQARWPRSPTSRVIAHPLREKPLPVSRPSFRSPHAHAKPMAVAAMGSIAGNTSALALLAGACCLAWPRAL